MTKGVALPTTAAHCLRPLPTYDCEEEADAVNVEGAFLGIGVHQEHHERPKDEEGDIADLEIGGRGAGGGSDRGGEGGWRLRPNPQSLANQAMNRPRVCQRFS